MLLLKLLQQILRSFPYSLCAPSLDAGNLSSTLGQDSHFFILSRIKFNKKRTVLTALAIKFTNASLFLRALKKSSFKQKVSSVALLMTHVPIGDICVYRYAYNNYAISNDNKNCKLISPNVSFTH